jgi:transcriptional regulator with XRE-family HTH domain
MALPKSQASLHCVNKAALYAIAMTLGNRIKAARERLEPKPTQREIAEKFDITDKAVSGWERDDSVPELDKMPKLARELRVPLEWLLDGIGDPPAPDDLQVRIEALSPADRVMLGLMIDALHTKRDQVA